MKILIPFSGGVNSTYTMWRWLTETDYEVVARYAIEEYENDEEDYYLQPGHPLSKDGGRFENGRKETSSFDPNNS